MGYSMAKPLSTLDIDKKYEVFAARKRFSDGNYSASERGILTDGIKTSCGVWAGLYTEYWGLTGFYRRLD